MTRLQKKCMVFSLGLHGLLAVILLASAGFGTRPQQTDLQVMTLILANIVDRAGAGGGTPVVNMTRQPPSQPQAAPVEPVHSEPVQRAQRPTPRPLPVPDESAVALESKPKPVKQHEVRVSHVSASPAANQKKSETNPSSESSSAARAKARRLKEIENSLAELASGVQNSGSPNNIVDVAGIGGGEAFAGYRDVVFSAYYHAWITPDDSASRLASADARVTIARDGSIVSAELVRPSNDRALDKSVERALREVTKLPPFPESARDTQRTFVIRFSLQAKEMSG